MRPYIHRMAPFVAALALAACDRAPAVDEDLKKDLEAASAGAIELAPMGTGTKVVSGVEQVKRTQPKTAAAPPKSPPVERAVAQTQDPSPTPSAEPAAVRPTSAPKVQPPPPGGYKTVGEVIRNAPFPIKP